MFVQLMLPRFLHVKRLRYHHLASAPKCVVKVINYISQRISRDVNVDNISVVSDLSYKTTYKHQDDSEYEDSIGSFESVGDDDTFITCMNDNGDDPHSKLTQTSSPKRVLNERKKSWPPSFCIFGSGEFTVAVDFVPIFSPLHRMSFSMISLVLACSLYHCESSDQSSSFEPLPIVVPLIEDSADDFVDSPHELYDKKSWLYRVCKASYRLALSIFRLKKSC
jgi:hypothetical protein